MNDIKIGDKVRCINTSDYIYICKNQIYTIIDVFNERILIDNGYNTNYLKKCFEKVEEQTMQTNEKIDVSLNLSNLSKEDKDAFMALITKANAVKPKRFRAKKDVRYYLIDGANEICISREINMQTDQMRYDANNYFETREQAEEVAFKRSIKAQLEIFALENNEKINWNDDNQTKFALHYDNKYKSIAQSTNCTVKIEGITYFSSIEILQKAITHIGEDNLKRYLIGVTI